jgi:hypothetical protein
LTFNVRPERPVDRCFVVCVVLKHGWALLATYHSRGQLSLFSQLDHFHWFGFYLSFWDVRINGLCESSDTSILTRLSVSLHVNSSYFLNFWQHVLRPTGYMQISSKINCKMHVLIQNLLAVSPISMHLGLFLTWNLTVTQILNLFHEIVVPYWSI